MYDFVPANFDRHQLRLNNPMPLELLSPLVQSTTTAELREFILTEAHDLADDLGFGWTAADVSYISCERYHSLIARSATTREPLAIAGMRAERTILLDSDSQLALGFWRAICKFRHTDRCDAASELQCDLTMVASAEASGLSAVATVYLEAELVGNTLLRVSGYDPPLDPRQYTIDVLTFAYADAIILEAERQFDAHEGAPKSHV